MSLCLCLCAYVSISLCTFTFMCRHLCMHVCCPDYISNRWSLQVCTAAASLCVPLIEISIARGPLMARTCVSHYSKLQMLLSKSRMFHSHFVISSTRKKLSAICDSRKTPSWILNAVMTDLCNHRPGDTHEAVQRHDCSFFQRLFLLCLESMSYVLILKMCQRVFLLFWINWSLYDIVFPPKTVKFNTHIVVVWSAAALKK